MSNFKSYKTEALLKAFAECNGDISGHIQRMAEIWVELVERGVNLTEWTNPMFSFFPDVAAGKLLPEILWKYGNNPGMLKVLSGVVPEDQAKLAKHGAKISVVDTSGKVVEKRPEDLTLQRLRIAIGDGRIRTPKEQIRLMPRSAPPEAPKRRNWNIAACLADYQCEAIEEMAEEAGLSPAEYLSKLLTDAKLIPVRRAARKGVGRSTHAEGMRASA